MDIQLTVTILLIHTTHLNNTLSLSEKTWVQRLPAVCTFPAKPQSLATVPTPRADPTALGQPDHKTQG